MTRIAFDKGRALQRGRADPLAVGASVWAHRQLLRRLVWRDITGRYKGSAFGILWAFLLPLLMLALYTLVFGVFLRSRWGGTGDSLGYSVVLFSGLLLFNFFSECVNRAPTLLVAHANYVKKVVFPLELLAWVALGTAFFHLTISLVVWALFSWAVAGQVPVTVAFLPLVVLPLALLVLALTWFFSALGVYLRDIGQFIGIATTMAMFLSPVFYTIDTVPERFRFLLYLNPLTFIVEQARAIMIAGVAPDFAGLALYTAIVLAAAWLALAWFQKLRVGFADVL